MPYDYKNELDSVRKYYQGDPLQKRFSALVTGETNAGKTYLLRSARKPIHIDSFDPGGTKCLQDLIEKGDVIADTTWETEDPFNPDKFDLWKKAVDRRIEVGYFEHFGTYCLDSATTWGESIQASIMKARSAAGEVPLRNKDYNPAKVHMQNYIRKLMNLPCDFILTGHLRENRKTIYIDPKTGITRDEVSYRFYTIGQAVITLPLLFDEIYVLSGKGGKGSEPRRELWTDSLGEYVARSRLKRDGKLDASEEPDIKAILKKAGFSSEDKPVLPKGGDADND